MDVFNLHSSGSNTAAVFGNRRVKTAAAQVSINTVNTTDVVTLKSGDTIYFGINRTSSALSSLPGAMALGAKALLYSHNTLMVKHGKILA